MKIKAMLALVFSLFMLSPLVAQAVEEEMKQETVYGWQLMTEQERAEYRERMRNMSAEEREQYRLEHHKKMQERAKERGVTLPEMPRQHHRGEGMGPGDGMGHGPGRQ
jgi:type III secretory pathway component EscR